MEKGILTNTKRINTCDLGQNSMLTQEMPLIEQLSAKSSATLPPKPPIVLNAQVACSANTSKEILWYIAKNIPDLRKWVVANPSSDAKILEYISQKGGPDVKHSLDVLLESYDYAKNKT